jgi:putative ABC transport system permease protein
MNILQNLSYVWRSLRRAPVFTAAVVLTLTVGIGSAVAIFTVVNAVLLRPLPYGHPDRLVNAWHDIPLVSLSRAQQTVGTYLTYRKFAKTIEGIALYDISSANVSDPDGRAEPQRMSVSWTTANLFPILEVPPKLGRAFTEAEDVAKGPNVAMISEGLWKTRFGGDKSVLGKKIVVAGRSTEIIGVMPASFRFPNSETSIWLPKQIDPNDPFPGGFSHFAVARLKPGVTIEAAQKDFARVLPRIVEVSPNLAPGVTTKMMIDQAKPNPLLIPMRDDVVGDIKKTLWMVAATAALVLLVTCANVANLLLVRADGRHRELSVRAALGAGQARVIALFFEESAVLAVLSAALGLGAASIAVRLLVATAPSHTPRLAEIHIDWIVVVFTVVIALLVAAACSAIPALRFVRAGSLSGLREGGRGGTVGGQRQRARSLLVGAQMAFALVVLAASGLLMRSFSRLHSVKPGFAVDGVATVWLSAPNLRYPNDSSVVRFYTQLTERVAQIPGVRDVGVTSRLPLETHGLDMDPIWVEGDEASTKKVPPLSLYTTVDAGYFRAMSIPLITGRTFDRIDRQHYDEAIISTETAKQFFHDSTGKTAIGKRFRQLPGTPWHTIIGVVGSTRDTSLSAPPSRVVYFPESVSQDTVINQFARTMAIVARTNGDVAGATRAIRQVIREIDPTLPTFDAQSMRSAADASIAQLSFTMVILGVAAGVTLILGVVGLYGVIAYVVTLRTRELGVRIALGAQPSAVATMVAKQGLVVSGAGIAVGLALVVVSARFLRSFLFEVAPTDPAILGGATVVLLGFALLASWIPARRAAKVNPLEALRAD